MLDISLTGLVSMLNSLVSNVDVSYNPIKDMAAAVAEGAKHLAVEDHNYSYSYSSYSYYSYYSYYYNYYYSYSYSYGGSYYYYYDSYYNYSYNYAYYGWSYSYDYTYDYYSSYYYYYDPDTGYYYDQKADEEFWLTVLYVFLGIIGFFLLLFIGGLLLMLIVFLYTGSSFLGLFIFPPMAICLITTGGRLSECTLGYIETDGTSWVYDTIFKPIYDSYHSYGY